MPPGFLEASKRGAVMCRKKRIFQTVVIAAVVCAGAGFCPVVAANSEPVSVQSHHHHHHHHGKAHIYSDKYIGKRTASGEVYNPHEFTAASPHLPLGSIAEVTHKITGKSLRVRINDKASSAGGVVVDLSKSAAKHLGIVDVAPVSVKLVSKDGVL